MNTSAILSNPIISTMSPEDVFHLLKKTEAMIKVKASITRRHGRPMLGCFADLLDVDQLIDENAERSRENAVAID